MPHVCCVGGTPFINDVLLKDTDFTAININSDIAVSDNELIIDVFRY